jgi:hypothetical protein
VDNPIVIVADGKEASVMKKKIFGGIVAAAIAAVGIAAAGPAGATVAVIGAEGDHSAVYYAAELQYAGMNEYTWQAASLGPNVCEQRSEGYSERQLIRLWDGPTTAEQSVAIVDGAEFHFCPGYENDAQPA